MLHVQETFINATEGHMIGESPVYETYTDQRGELYRAMVKEYGRCTGKVFIDREDAPAQHVGWCFIKRDRYEDTGETYLREVWVTLHERAPETTVRHFFADAG